MSVEDVVHLVEVGGPPDGYNGHMDERTEPFWRLVDRTGGPEACWPWTGARSRLGYGVTRHEGRPGIGAHRIAYWKVVGPTPVGMELDHLCRNRACVNPAHLEPVTHAENVRRAFALKTACRNGHPYADGNLVIDPWSGARRCRACRSAQNIERKRRKRVHTGPLVGERHPNAKVSEAMVRAIRESSETNDSLAQRFGISRSNIWLIRTHRAWASVR